MTETRTKTLSDGTRLNVTVHNEQKYHRKHKHQFVYAPEVTPGEAGAKCQRCGLARTNKIHSGVRGQ